MMNEKEVQERLNRRLSGLAASQQRHIRIRAAIDAERKEEKPMKRRISMTLAITLAAMLIATVAIAEYFNLFSFFGERDERYNAVAPYATLTVIEPSLVTNPELGTATVAIDSAYFDGLSLNIAYRITNGRKLEAYTPSEAELALMKEADAGDMVVPVSENEPNVEIIQAWNTAIQNRTPYGYRKTAVYTSDHTLTDDGVDIYPDSASSMYNEQGEFCEMREFACPLPEEVSNRQELRVNIGIYQQTVYYWFDGLKCYWRNERTETGTMTATIPRNADPKLFTGTGKINGIACSAEAEVSPMATVVTITSEAPFNTFLQLPPTGTEKLDCWIEVNAVDQAGKELRPQGISSLDNQTECTAILTGTGEMPENLTLYIDPMWVGMDESSLADSDCIIMKAVQ